MYTLIDDQVDFLVINKEANVSVHDESGDGLIKQLRADFNNNEIAPVHRLDKATSGLMLCSKHGQAGSVLSSLFQHRQVEKYYLALSNKKPLKKQGLIAGDMTRTRNGSWKLCKSRNNPAVTQFFSYGIEAGGRIFILKPHTGKTHQLRVALKSLGSPIIGDKRYGTGASEYETMSLHAYILRFSLNGRQYQFKSLPSWEAYSPSLLDFVTQNLDTPWQLPWPSLPASYQLIKESRSSSPSSDKDSKV